MGAIDYKDKHKGERAFVLGNGPSLTVEALDRLAGETTFAVNRIARIFDRTSWRPTYYVGVTDAIRDERHRGDILRGVRAAQAAFCWGALYREHLNGAGNVVYVDCSHAGEVTPEEAHIDFWSTDIAARVDKFGVSVFPALQIAAYMGFAAIYLLGCDGGYRPPENGVDLSHFDPGYRPFHAYANYDYDDLNRALLRAHEIAEAAARLHGFRIYNCSPGSLITAHEKIDLGSVLA